MKPPAEGKTKSPLSKWLFLSSLITLVLSCVAFGIFMHLNRTIKVTGALMAVLAAAIMAFSLQSMRKRPEAAAMQK